MIASCKGCDATWTGENYCHCSSCHRTFSVVRLFDLHRPNYRCADPARLRVKNGKHAGELRMRLGSRGVWVSAENRPEFYSGADESVAASA